MRVRVRVAPPNLAPPISLQAAALGEAPVVKANRSRAADWCRSQAEAIGFDVWRVVSVGGTELSRVVSCRRVSVCGGGLNRAGGVSAVCGGKAMSSPSIVDNLIASLIDARRQPRCRCVSRPRAHRAARHACLQRHACLRHAMPAMPPSPHHIA
eukprot:scaffold17835_cov58-Phaeocystis_antarctica.AAC.3